MIIYSCCKVNRPTLDGQNGLVLLSARLEAHPGRFEATTRYSWRAPFSARSKSHSRSSASPCCLLLVAALRTRLEPLFRALRGRKSTPPAAAAPGEQSQHTQWRTSSCRTAACTGARHTYAERARAWPRARVASCSTMPRSRHGNRTRLGALGGQNKAMSRGEDGKQPSDPSVTVGVSSNPRIRNCNTHQSCLGF